MADCRDVLVSVGTTAFDKLVLYVMGLDLNRNVKYQVSSLSKIKFQQDDANIFDFIQDIRDLYQRSLVVTHCGAGTVFTLLELGVDFIAVANVEDRIDHHQLEICEYLKVNSLAPAFANLNEFSSAMIEYKNDLQELIECFQPKPYSKKGFNYYDFHKAIELISS